MPAQTLFRLLDLPPELRTLIYAFVLEGHITKVYKRPLLAPLRSRLARSPAPALLLTSKHLHHEAVALFCDSTSVIWDMAFGSWQLLDALPRSRWSAIPRVEIHHESSGIGDWSCKEAAREFASSLKCRGAARLGKRVVVQCSRCQ